MAFLVNSNFVVLAAKKFLGLGRLMAKRQNYKDLRRKENHRCIYNVSMTSSPLPPYLIQPQTPIRFSFGGRGEM